MQRALIFDLDGTLIDSLPGISASLNRSLAALGLPVHATAAIRGFIGDGSRMLAFRAAPAGADAHLVDSIENLFKADYNATWPDGTFAFPGIHGLLEDLQQRGFLLGVLSNKPDPFTRSIVQTLFPSIRFVSVLGQRPGIPHKPDPAGALEIADAASLPPGSCTIVGDSTIDIETARHAGMASIAVTWGYHDSTPLEAACPDGIAGSVETLLDRLG